MIGFTWGPLFRGKKVVFRSASKHACAALNRLWAKSDPMSNVCDAWEDVQFLFGFEALVVFCEGKRNVWADIASRSRAADVEDELRAAMMTARRPVAECQRVNVVWRRGAVTCDEQRLFPYPQELTLPHLVPFFSTPVSI